MGIRLKEVLSEKGITQKELAEKLGISVVGMSKIATGNPTVETLQKIADALNVGLWELFISKEEINQDSHEAECKCPHCGHSLKIRIE